MSDDKKEKKKRTSEFELIFPDKEKEERSREDDDEELDLDDVIEEEEREKIREWRALRLEEAVLKRKKNVEDLKRQIEGSGGADIDVYTLLRDPKTREEFLSLSDEQRDKLINTIVALKLASNPSNSTVLPILIQSLKSNPSTKSDELAEFAKRLIEVVKPQQQTQSESLAEKILLKMLETRDSSTTLAEKLAQAQREALQAQFQAQMQLIMKELSELKNRPTAVDELQNIKQQIEVLGSLLGKGGGSYDPELEKLKLETQTKLKEMEIGLQKWMAEQNIANAKEERSIELVNRLIDNVLNPRINDIMNIVANRLSGKEEANPVVGAAAKAAQEVMTKIACPNCGKDILVPANATKVVCPNCGAEVTAE